MLQKQVSAHITMIDKEGIGVTTDNNDAYLQLLDGVVSSVDSLASITVNRTNHDWKFRIVPSHPQHIEAIIYEVITMNNIFGIRVDFCKSMKNASTVTFSISLT